MNKLEINNLTKQIEDKIILNNISFELKSGQILGIIGDSGSGKSTLLKCISLLKSSSNGFIIIDEHKVNLSKNPKKEQNYNKIKSKIGMVFQDYNLWPHMSVLENIIEAPIQVNGESKETATLKALNILEKFNLKDKISSMPEELSGGEKQRVAIARSLIMKPEIILFDEPSSALDPNMVNKLGKIIKNLAYEGIAIILTSHEISFIKKIADKVIFLANNKIVEQGNVDILDNPNTLELQKFMNHEN